MDATYRVREALNYPEDEDVDTTAYSPTISETNIEVVGSHMPVVRVEVWSEAALNEALTALSSAGIEPARVINEDELTPPTDAAEAIDIPIPFLHDEPVVLEFPEAYDYEPTEVSWDNLFYPAKEVRLYPTDRQRRGAVPLAIRQPSNLMNSSNNERRLKGRSQASYRVEFTDIKGNDHKLVQNFGHPELETGEERFIPFESLETAVDALRTHGVPERVVRYLDL